jgi:type IV secretion system protein VirD4
VDGGADYWVRQAEILLTGLLGTAALDPDRTMLDVAHWVFTKDIPVKNRPNEILEILRDVKANGTPASREAAAAAMLQLDAVWSLDERVRSSVYATVQTVVQAWLDPAVDASATLTSRRSQRFVDLDWLVDPQTSNTLYLVAPLDDQKRLAPVLGGLLGDLKDQAYQRDVAGVGLGRPLLMVIDEAGNMPLAWLPEVAATCAGIGILLVTIWQSKAQLDAAYGRLSDSVLTNHLTKIVFSGCSDPATLDYVSRLLGDEDVPRRSVSYDVGGGSGRRSISESTNREALTPFHLLRQVRPGEAVLIHATLPPAHLQARRYWTEPALRDLSGAVVAP